MTSKLSVIALASSVLALAASACGGPPKQAEVADVDKDTGADMAPTESAPTPGEGDKAGEEEMKAKCCAECKAGLAKDRSGASPDTVPCADFTDTLSPWCLEHFRAQPTVAAKCQ
ncbi:MAG: hypothetical protein IT372_13010 [Polyangiaceae bacterium]|nr:hypothetical protein [Polyangiaceae bacterium]